LVATGFLFLNDRAENKMRQTSWRYFQISDYFRDTRGAIIPIFAVAITLLAFTVGIAVDYSRAYTSRSAVQTALDAAVFAAARSSVLQGAEPNAAVQQFFNKTAIKKYGVTISQLSGAKRSDGVFEGVAVGSVKTSFLGIAGDKDLAINVKSEVIYGFNSLEVALVLDATNSMSGTKFTTMKTAAKDLVDTLYATPEASKKVKVAVVPFARYVNVGTGNRYASWIDVPADYSETNNVCSTTKPVIDKQGCRIETGNATNDGVPYTYTYEVCDSYTYGPEETNCSDQTSNYTWNGCVGSRHHPLNTKDDGYGSRIPGLLNTWCPSALSPLSKSKLSIKSDIDAMTTSGDTYIPSGLIWGGARQSK
jgi:Flp pilus assembly protein TadG